MLSVSLTVATAVIYLLILFAIAYRGDRSATQPVKPYRYALAQSVQFPLGVFWHGYSVGSLWLGVCANHSVKYGVFILTCCTTAPVSFLKQQNITSIADLIGTRYGKSPLLASVVAMTALIAVALHIPAIACRNCELLCRHRVRTESILAV